MFHRFTVIPWMTWDFINVPVNKPEIRVDAFTLRARAEP